MVQRIFTFHLQPSAFFCNKNLLICKLFVIKFMFSKKATKIDQIFTVDLTFTKLSKCQINGEDFFNFCSLLRKHEL